MFGASWAFILGQTLFVLVFLGLALLVRRSWAHSRSRTGSDSSDVDWTTMDSGSSHDSHSSVGSDSGSSGFGGGTTDDGGSSGHW